MVVQFLQKKLVFWPKFVVLVILYLPRSCLVLVACNKTNIPCLFLLNYLGWIIFDIKQNGMEYLLVITTIIAIIIILLLLLVLLLSSISLLLLFFFLTIYYYYYYYNPTIFVEGPQWKWNFLLVLCYPCHLVFLYIYI